MLKRRYLSGLAFILSLGLISTLPAAESKHGHHGKHDHHDEKKGHHDEKKGRQGGHAGRTHRHAKWEPPPAKYASMHSDRWTNNGAIARGKKLFQTNCELCHGVDGRGTGPGAKGLQHAPADLNNHFHMKPGGCDRSPSGVSCCHWEFNSLRHTNRFDVFSVRI